MAKTGPALSGSVFIPQGLICDFSMFDMHGHVIGVTCDPHVEISHFFCKAILGSFFASMLWRETQIKGSIGETDGPLTNDKWQNHWCHTCIAPLCTATFQWTLHVYTQFLIDTNGHMQVLWASFRISKIMDRVFCHGEVFRGQLLSHAGKLAHTPVLYTSLKFHSMGP